MLNDGILAANAGADAARPEAAEVATLLPRVETVDALPPESLPGLIAGLAALQARAAARLPTPPPAPPPNAPPEPDMISCVREVARIWGRSLSWDRMTVQTC